MLRYVNRMSLLLAFLLVSAPTAFAQEPPPTVDIVVTQTLDEPIRDVAITPDAHHIYVITESGALLGFAFDPTSAELTPLEGFPLELAGISYRPTALAVAPSGTVVYVAHEGTVGRSLLAPVTILSRDTESGALTERRRFSLPVDGTPLTDIAFSSGGDTLVVAGVGGNHVALIPLEQMTDNGISGDFPRLALDEKPAAVAISADSQFVYVVSTEAGTVTVFGFNSASGSFEQIEESPFPVSGNAYQPIDLAISGSSTRLYVAHSGFIQRSLLAPVTFHGVNPATGAVSDLSRTGFPSQGSGLAAISVDGSDQFFVVADNGRNMLFVARQALPQIQPAAGATLQAITLEPYRDFCTAVAPRLCYVATIDGVQQLFYSGIEGFEYEWGTRYELVVRVEPVVNPPADAASVRYVLDSVTSAEPVAADYTFTISLPPAVIEASDAGIYRVLGELEFVCSGLGCDALPDLLNGRDPIAFVMRFPAEAGGPLEARLLVER